jgi:hypothetical protein
MSGINDAFEDTIGKSRDLKSIPTAQHKQIPRSLSSTNTYGARFLGLNSTGCNTITKFDRFANFV